MAPQPVCAYLYIRAYRWQDRQKCFRYSASSFESKMLAFLLFSFHRRRTRGPRKMIFCVCNYQSFVSVCAENNLGSVNIHRIIILIWHGVWLLDLQRFLRQKNRRELW